MSKINILGGRDLGEVLPAWLFSSRLFAGTYPQIKDCLRELGLKFCGFETGDMGRNFKLNNTGAGDPYDLDKWNLYEKANPNTFGRMYQFWCQNVA